MPVYFEKVSICTHFFLYPDSFTYLHNIISCIVDIVRKVDLGAFSK